MKDFLFYYWRELLDLIIIITSVILFIFSRRKNNPALEQVIFKLPSIISYVEEKFGSGHGADKKQAAMSICSDMFFKLSGIKLEDSSYFSNIISNQIEKVLSTPSRKEIK